MFLDQNEYIRKVIDFFNTNNITKIPRNPTNKFAAQTKKLIKSCNTILTEYEKKSLITMNPKTRKFHGQPKIHKNLIPIRPVVNCIDSPTYLVSRKLNKLLTKYYKYHKTFTIKKSRVLANKIKNITIPITGKFVSFDITNLYTNIPIQETIKL